MKFLIGAGGTGGHLYPAIAVANEIKKQMPNADFVFAGRADKIEGRVVPEMGIEFIPLSIMGSRNVKSIIYLFLSAIKLKKYIKKNDISAVICTGAYISIPPGMAAMRTKTPLFLLESNVNPGKAIKLLASKANTIYTTFTETEEYFNATIATKLSCQGNPIRKDIINLPEKKEALKKYNISTDKPILLVFGGSLGAESINRTMEENINALSEKANILWQTGKNYSVSITPPTNVQVLEYIDDMATAYAIADLVVSRSGATTVTELCVAGKPAILIPYKHSANNEQFHNAQFLKEHAGTILIDNDDVTKELSANILKLIADKARLLEMAQKTKILGKPEAAKNIARSIIEKIKE